jgi:phosphoglycerol transferase MdoB-like AlkP superfamily enzyme
MFTIGNVLTSKDYDVRYIYGGNAFFDNMGKYFGGNGYTVLDKRDIPENLVSHITAWGVYDEASFDFTLHQCDKSFNEGKLFFIT